MMGRTAAAPHSRTLPRDLGACLYRDSCWRRPDVDDGGTGNGTPDLPQRRSVCLQLRGVPALFQRPVRLVVHDLPASVRVEQQIDDTVRQTGARPRPRTASPRTWTWLCATDQKSARAARSTVSSASSMTARSCGSSTVSHTGQPPQILAARVLVPHRVLEQAVNQRAPRHPRVGATRRRVRGDDLRRVVRHRINRARHLRDVPRLCGDRRHRPRGFARMAVRGLALGIRAGARRY